MLKCPSKITFSKGPIVKRPTVANGNANDIIKFIYPSQFCIPLQPLAIKKTYSFIFIYISSSGFQYRNGHSQCCLLSIQPLRNGHYRCNIGAIVTLYDGVDSVHPTTTSHFKIFRNIGKHSQKKILSSQPINSTLVSHFYLINHEI